MKRALALGVLALVPLPASAADPSSGLQPMDVFELEVAGDPQISPDGTLVVYERRFRSPEADGLRSNLWVVHDDGRGHRPLTSGDRNDTAPRWSPDGTRVAYVSSAEGSAQLYARWMDSGQTARLAQLPEAPSAPVWSPDGRWIAFTMFVEERADEPFAELPRAPEGAEWAPLPTVITQIHYRQDGQGYLQQGHRQLFVLPAEGGTPRQLTQGSFDVAGDPAWTPDGAELVLSSNRRDDSDLEPLDSELWALALDGGALRQLTDRRGPDHSPAVSPDGALLAYLGFDDRRQGYQVTKLHVLPCSGGPARVLTAALDRDVARPVWSADGKRIHFHYDDEGDTRIGAVDLGGQVQELIGGVGGVELGRPYDSGSFSLSSTGRIAYTGTSAERPADVFLAVAGRPDGTALTRLNEDLLAQRALGRVEAAVLRVRRRRTGGGSRAGSCTPPGFDPRQKYPLLLEIHGGPFANYGPRFAAEMQLYAAAGYVVLYTNPRGSTSYGEEFGNLIHHAYPGDDYDDLMSGRRRGDRAGLRGPRAALRHRRQRRRRADGLDRRPDRPLPRRRRRPSRSSTGTASC